MSNRIIYICVYIISFTFITTSFASSELPYVEGELLVKFAPKTNRNQHTTIERNQILSSFNSGQVKGTFRRIPGLTLVKLPENLTVEEALSKLKNKSEIIYAEPNYKVRTASIFPDDPRGPDSINGGEQWGLYNIGQTNGTSGADINAPEAWDIITDSEIIVAVIDTGVDYTHPDLSDNMWTDANGNHGYDFCTYDDNQEDPNPMDDAGHGTHVAGIIGAIGDNGLGISGVCWRVRIMAVKA